MPRRKSVNSFDLAFRLGQASLHTNLTLWHRLPMLAVTGKARDVPELNRMVSEKIAAMVDGTFNSPLRRKCSGSPAKQ
jgi:hypothetical protein